MGTEGHGEEPVQTGVNWCVAGKEKAKGEARQKERDWGRAKTWAVDVMATRHREGDVRGRAPSSAARALGTPGCRRNRDSSSQGRTADPCLCKHTQAERHLCVPM